MNTILLGCLWWCLDDWLAAVTQTPWVGRVPIWVPFTIALMLNCIGLLFQRNKA